MSASNNLPSLVIRYVWTTEREGATVVIDLRPSDLSGWESTIMGGTGEVFGVVDEMNREEVRQALHNQAHRALDMLFREYDARDTGDQQPGPGDGGRPFQDRAERGFSPEAGGSGEADAGLRGPGGRSRTGLDEAGRTVILRPARWDDVKQGDVVWIDNATAQGVVSKGDPKISGPFTIMNPLTGQLRTVGYRVFTHYSDNLLLAEADDATT